MERASNHTYMTWPGTSPGTGMPHEKVVRDTERSRNGSRSFSRISLRDFSGVMKSGLSVMCWINRSCVRSMRQVERTSAHSTREREARKSTRRRAHAHAHTTTTPARTHTRTRTRTHAHSGESEAIR